MNYENDLGSIRRHAGEDGATLQLGIGKIPGCYLTIWVKNIKDSWHFYSGNDSVMEVSWTYPKWVLLLPC